MATTLIFPEETVSLNKIKPGPYQARTTFNPEKLAGLARSIEAGGLIDPPIVVRENGHFNLLAGERRWRAMCALALSPKLGFDEAVEEVCQATAPQWLAGQPAVAQATITVRVAPPDADLELISTVENMQRQNLLPSEMGRGFLVLKNKGYSVSRIAKGTGSSDGIVKARLLLLELEPEIQDYVDAGQISKDLAVIESLLSIPAGEIRLRLARRFSERHAPIKVIVSACEKTLAALRDTAQPTPAAIRPSAYISVSQAQVVVQPPQPVVAHVPAGPQPCFCPACQDLIDRLRENLCGGCSVNGLGQQCLTCPGVIDLINQLLAYSQVKDGASD